MYIRKWEIDNKTFCTSVSVKGLQYKLEISCAMTYVTSKNMSFVGTVEVLYVDKVCRQDHYKTTTILLKVASTSHSYASFHQLIAKYSLLCRLRTTPSYLG